MTAIGGQAMFDQLITDLRDAAGTADAEAAVKAILADFVSDPAAATAAPAAATCSKRSHQRVSPVRRQAISGGVSISRI